MSYWRATRRRHIEELGWQIDSVALCPHEGFKVHTIPSPARRERPDIDWVLDTVPLKAPIRGTQPVFYRSSETTAVVSGRFPMSC